MATRAASAVLLVLTAGAFVLVGAIPAGGQICVRSQCDPPEVTATSSSTTSSSSTSSTSSSTTSTTAGGFDVGGPVQVPDTTPTPDDPDVAAPPRAPVGLPITGGDVLGLLVIGLAAIAFGGALFRSSRS